MERLIEAGVQSGNIKLSGSLDIDSPAKIQRPRNGPIHTMQSKNAMTVDVEDYFHVSAFSNSISRDSWSKQESRVVANTRRLLELFAETNVRATFFVLGCVAEQFPHLVREIANSGHEVACHGYSHRLVYTQSPTEFRDETRRSKECLEDQIGAAVLGYRAASYSIVRDSLWALDILVELGFKYDSSIFPVHHDRYGIPGAERMPHSLITPNKNAIVEWPLSTAKLFSFRLPVAGGGYFRLLPYQYTLWGLRSINGRENKPFIFYLHPWEIDTGQPRVKAGMLSQFRHYTNIAACESRLRQLIADFDFGTAREALTQLDLLDKDPAVNTAKH